jgi:hypothetical protein
MPTMTNYAVDLDLITEQLTYLVEILREMSVDSGWHAAPHGTYILSEHHRVISMRVVTSAPEPELQVMTYLGEVYVVNPDQPLYTTGLPR